MRLGVDAPSRRGRGNAATVAAARRGLRPTLARRAPPRALDPGAVLLRELAATGVVAVVEVSGDLVTAASASLLRLLGRHQADVARRRLQWSGLLAPGTEARQRRAQRELQRRGWCRSFEVELVRRDGRRMPVVLGAARSGRRPLRWTAFVRDLSAQRRAGRAARREVAGLGQVVAKQTRELRSAVRRLRREVEKRRQLQREVLETSELERRRLGEDLHDSLGQELTALRYAASSIERRLRAGRRTEAELVATMGRQLERSHELTRKLAHALHPVAALDGALAASLASLATWTRDLYPVDCRYRGASTVTLPDQSAATHLVRIAREAVTNAARHGRPRHIWIDLTQRGDRMRLAVTDDGTGMQASKRSGEGLGLRIMAHRAAVMGAALRVRRRAGGGTLVSCTVPTRQATPRRRGHDG